MNEFFRILISFDHDATAASAALHWTPATAAMTLVSAWWVKGPLLVATGWCADLAGRRRVPLAALAATAGFCLASWLNLVLKAVAARDRPPEAIGLDALVGMPGSPSFPSGHAMSAFAAAGAVALLAPRLRWPVLGLATLVAASRVYLGVHFLLDVLVGAALGLALGLAVAWPLRRRCGCQSPA